MAKMISWNVNGFRAILRKGFEDFFKNADVDIFCIQETKMQAGQAEFSPPGYECYWNFAERKGYSGTAVFTKKKPLKVTYGINMEDHDREGRVLTLEYEKFYLVNVYTPNSQKELARLQYRQLWEDDFRRYLKDLDGIKPVILCGDLNVAHREIDLANPKSNEKNAGFSPEEREKFTILLGSGFIDTYRHFYPDKTGMYTWWTYMYKAREKNLGWRIDYFVVSDRLKDKLKDALILNEIYGSDHCPVMLDINMDI